MWCRVPVHLLRQDAHEDELGNVNLEAAFNEKIGHLFVSLLTDNMSVLVTLEHTNSGILQYDLEPRKYERQYWKAQIGTNLPTSRRNHIPVSIDLIALSHCIREVE